MPYLPTYLRYALTDGEITHDDEGKKIVFNRIKIADLHITSSEISACDPLVCYETASFSQRVQNGQFPVFLSIAQIGTDQRVGFAALVFSEGPVRRWQMAVLASQDLKTLKPDGIFGYGVDSGTGCFMDSNSAALLAARMNGEDAYYDVIIDELDKTQVNTWAWAKVELSNNPLANFVAFSTGYGDGMYASYFGFDDSDMPVCLVTDFALIYEKPVEEVPKKNRWLFWKR